jgi:hypothetical protein
MALPLRAVFYTPSISSGMGLAASVPTGEIRLQCASLGCHRAPRRGASGCALDPTRPQAPALACSNRYGVKTSSRTTRPAASATTVPRASGRQRSFVSGTLARSVTL